MKPQQRFTRQKHLSLEFTSSEWHGILQDALRAPAPLSPKATRAFLALAIIAMYKHLSMGKIAVFEDIRSGGLTPPSIFFPNAPVDDYLPPTPSDGRWSNAKRTYVTEFILAGIMQLLGVPFCLLAEKDGLLWSQNVAAEGKENDRSSLGARVKLGFHKELVALTEYGLCCDWLGLICLRQDAKKEAVTAVADVRDVLPSLTPRQIKILSEPWFQFKVPNSFSSNSAFSSPMPLLAGSNPPMMNINFSPGMCSIVNDHHEASMAFEHFDRVLETADVITEFKLSPGNLLIINNIWAAHSRSIFDPSNDGFGRWLQRMYVSYNLFAARATVVPGMIHTYSN